MHRRISAFIHFHLVQISINLPINHIATHADVRAIALAYCCDKWRNSVVC